MANIGSVPVGLQCWPCSGQAGITWPNPVPKLSRQTICLKIEKRPVFVYSGARGSLCLLWSLGRNFCERWISLRLKTSVCMWVSIFRKASNLMHINFIFVIYYLLLSLNFKKPQLISCAFQRCRLLEDLCRLTVILKSSPASDPHAVRISSKFSPPD